MVNNDAGSSDSLIQTEETMKQTSETVKESGGLSVIVIENVPLASSMLMCLNFRFPILWSLHMKFEFNWPSGFRGEDV